ncbi:hypothetical protein [Flavobacterium sp. DG2-3]|uniref:hypothetical protein n=1 Tax=Flavobacterium sp. DG2-3 TaxID=3068317 RepID=UPI00273FA869|nr:hypothetical protein [Flavobacterium sp. DG2-3]MDP5198096.1 hypothetical protein [Flavobacterium sp. DG2-3]
MKLKKYYLTTLFLVSLLVQSCATVEDVALSAENEIQSFTITRGELSKEFEISDDSITGIVESNFELNDLTLKVLISKGAKINPDPATIKSITAPFALTVIAENGEDRVYNVDIKREPSVENSVLEFNLTNEAFTTTAKINLENGEITKRIPEFVDLKNLSIDLKFSKYATISPDPKTIKDYSSPVSFTVKSESGLEKVYQVKFEYMNNDRFQSCTDANSDKWFGGDDRTNVPDILPFDRNVGTGQTIIVDKDLVPSVFSVDLKGGFRYFQGNTNYDKAVTLKLVVRDENSKILATTTTDVPAGFSGGMIPFDLTQHNIFMEAGKKYKMFWYVVNGDVIGVNSGSNANSSNGSGFCFNSGWAGESKKSKNTTLEDLSVWYEHWWHFNIELEGKE